MKHLLLTLVDILETDSEESKSLERSKQRDVASSHDIAAEPPGSPCMKSAVHIDPQPTSPRYPSSVQITDKRKVSDTSFGTRSTESTPNRLVHPETKVQSLQNKFVEAIIYWLWDGQIPLPWVNGRHMFLTYSEFVQVALVLTLELTRPRSDIHYFIKEILFLVEYVQLLMVHFV